jgi:hypothetical protein
VRKEKSSPESQRAVVVGIAALVVLLVCWFLWGRSPPQMGTEEEVVRNVDALFTAVTARDDRLLGDCEQRLRALHDGGKLPPDAWDYLDGIISKARDGHWEPAAEKLYGFMRAQRREGGRERAARKEPGRRDDLAAPAPGP